MQRKYKGNTNDIIIRVPETRNARFSKMQNNIQKGIQRNAKDIPIRVPEMTIEH